MPIVFPLRGEDYFYRVRCALHNPFLPSSMLKVGDLLQMAKQSKGKGLRMKRVAVCSPVLVSFALGGQ
jgi:hypothetical protein